MSSLLVLVAALAAAPALAATSDDFNDCFIDGATWTASDPVGGSSFSIVGAGSNDARLSISVPAGLSHDPWSNNDAARLTQPIANTDFQVQVKIESALTAAFQAQGIIVEQNASNWMRFDFLSDGTALRIFSATSTGGVPTARINQVIGALPSAVPLYLRVTRAANQWTLEYSSDGAGWTVGGSYAHTIAVTRAGVFASNFGSGGSAPAHTGLFDYFFDTTTPVVPEDGPLPGGRTLTVNIVGNGSVLRSLDQVVYYCSETVSLTATPAVGWIFEGWGGALSGSANPQQVILSVNHTVSATFVDSSLQPPQISSLQIIPGDTFATARWTTSEPATSRVDWRGTFDASVRLAYGFEEAAGTTAVDASSAGSDGTLQNGSTRLAPGYFGKAASFSGSGGNVSMGNLDFSGSAITFAMWINPDGFGIFDARLISKSNGTAATNHWWMLSTLGTQLRFRLKTTVGDTGTLIGVGPDLAAGQWTHVAATYDGAQMRLYQNGVLIGSLAKTGAIVENPSIAAWIGDNPSLGKSFDGRIDEVRVWNRALTSTEITAEMERPSYTDTVENETLAVSHEEVLTGLTPLTQYHYMVTSEDSSAMFSSTSDGTFSTLDVQSGAFLSDDFNTCALGPWTFTAPLGDSSYALEGAGTSDARLRISVPSGLSHDPWTSFDAPRITQPAQNTDFQIETKIQSVFTQGVQEQGIVVEGTAGRWARFDFVYDGTVLRAFAAVNTGVPSARISHVVASGAPPPTLWLRVTRAGDLWTEEYSTDGAQWTTAGTFSQAMTVTAVGAFAGNFQTGGPAPAFDAIFDYFFDTAAPVLPEDGGPLDSRTLNTSVVGSGSIQRSPDQSVFNCGAQVTLTAVPAPGFVLSGWSGALTGFRNPSTLAMTANFGVTATFIPDAAPPIIAELDVIPGETSATITWLTNEAATSRVEFGETTASQFWDIVDSPAHVSQHSITLLGLSPDTEYFFHVRSTDEESQTTTSADDSFRTLPETVVPFQSDDFNDCDPTATGPWTFVDPSGNASFAVAGAGTSDLRLQITVPGGSNHDPWGTNGSARLMQPANDVDFQLEVKLDSALTQNTQQQGILIEQDADDWMRFDFIYKSPNVRVFAARTTAGVPQTRVDRVLPTVTGPIWMRVTRTGNLWRQQWSTDGLAWTTAGTFTSSLTVTKVGVFAGNYHVSGAAPAHTASFDYFFETATPILPEDAGSSIIGRTLTINPSGNGGVIRSPDQPLYYCNAQVGLIATPQPGNAFVSWGGDLAGFNPIGSLVMSTSRTVSVTFQAAPGPPQIANVSVEPAAGSAVIRWTTNEPSTSRIDVGPTPSYTQTVQDGTLRNVHALEVSGLLPNTQYHYSITAVDSDTLGVSRPDATFTTTSADFDSTDFQTCALDPGRWSYIDPLADSTFSFSGSGTADAQLVIEVASGVSHDMWTTADAPRVMQPALDNDFEIEFKIEAPMTLGNQMQGVLIQATPSHWLRFDFVGTSSSLRAFAASHVNGVPAIRIDQAIPGGHGASPLWMRISRVGHVWTETYSLNGTTWTTAGTFVHVLPVTAVGVFAGNANDNPPLTARFDYFSNRAAPIVPEDGGAPGPPAMLTLNTVGNGLVVADPQKSIYYCDETVVLSAEPDPGSQFTAWSGDLGGNDTPIPLAMTGNREVTGTFTVAGGPPVISLLNVDAHDDFAIVTWRTNEPASSRVEWGPTSLYGSTVDSAALVTRHSLTLTGLLPETLYHFRVRSVDVSSQSTFSSNATFTTTARDFKSDDFNVHNLSSIWTFYDPAGDSGYSISGAGTGDSKLSIHVPAGKPHDPWTEYGAPRLMQPALDRDFQVEVRIDAVMALGNQQHGLLVEESPTRWIRFDFVHNGEDLLAFAASHLDGVPTARILNEIFAGPSPAPIWLRVTRTGDLWRHEYSFDGSFWLIGGSFIEPLTVTKVGLFAGNAAQNPAHTAVFDYFSRTAFPITAEDQATPPPDTRAPAILSPRAVSGETFFRVLWITDEPAVCHIDYGQTPGYELGTISSPLSVVQHAIDATGLVVDTDYHYRIVCQDAQGNMAVSGDRSIRVQPVQITVFYGSTQSFGDIGVHQQWANVLGNAFDADGIASLTYSLNGGAEEPLTPGPDLRRLALEGDFAIEIDRADLQVGPNTVRITGTDTIGSSRVVEVTILHSVGNVWPAEPSIDFSQVTNLLDVGRVVDGEWTMTPAGLRTVVPSYDRLVAIGDVDWTDYEALVLLQAHSVNEVYDGVSGGAAVGLGIRWNGHTPFDEAQPRWGFWPLGSLAWYRWVATSQRFGLVGNEENAQVADRSGRLFEIGVDYYFRARVETLAAGASLYSFRAWKAADPEPVSWQLQIVLDPDEGPASGSMLLLAHHVDATFKTVSVTSLAGCDGPARTLTTNVAGPGSVLRDPDAAQYLCDEDVSVAAEPAPGSQFTGWSGDLGGNVNPGTVSMTADRTVTATFQPAPGAPVISDVEVDTGDTWATIRWTTNEPATSLVDFGLTAGYELGAAARQPLVTRHSITREGLAPATLHHFRVSSTDSDSLNSVTGDATFVTDPAVVTALRSDDFNACALDTGLWTFTDPFGLADYEVAGGGSGTARIELRVAGGVRHDLWTRNNVPRLMQPIANTDFEIEVKFDSTMGLPGVGQGLLIRQNNTNWLRFDVFYDGEKVRAFAARTTNGVPAAHIDQVIGVGPSPVGLRLRVTRTGDQWTFRHSLDGATWVVAGSFTSVLTATTAGPFITTVSLDGTIYPHSALIDYVIETSSWVQPEDGGVVGPGYALAVNHSGNGQVTQDRQQPLFHCEEVVTLEALPDPGWVFTGWTGDLGGVINPVAFPMTAEMTIGADFALNTGPPIIGNVQVVAQHNWARVTWYTNEVATSRVDHGTSASYGNFESSSTPVTQHSLLLTGLTPGTQYHYKITSVDGDQLVAATGDATFTTPLFVPGPFLSDDFGTCSLNPVWTWFDPLGDASYRISGGGTADARLSITAPGGLSHNPWTALNAPRLMQPLADEDFQVEVRFESAVSLPFQEQGIVAVLNNLNFLRFEFFADGTSVWAFASATVGGVPTPLVQLAVAPAPSIVPMGLRVTRVGSVWTLEHTLDDGTTWLTDGAFVSTLPVTSIGPFAGNSDPGGGAPAHTAIVDYFFETLLPVVPEDAPLGVPGNALTVNVVGSGQVDVDRDQELYYCNDEVFVQVTPASGWVFAGWSDDLSGVTNPETVVMDDDRTVTATFTPNTTPPIIDDVEVAVGDTSATITWVTNEGATSRVNYGTTSGYGQFVQNLTFKTQHSIVLNGLLPDTTYHFQIRSLDASGLPATTPNDTFATTPLIDRPFESEDFDTNQLDSRIWTFHNPLGDASFFLSGEGTPDARVHIVVPGGLSHDPWASNTAPRLMQDAENRDFQLEVKMESSVNARFQEQGVIVEADANNWLRLELHSNGTELRAFGTAVVNGVPSVKVNKGIGPIPSGVPIWMRVTRQGNQFTHEHSFNGQNWIVNATFSQAMVVSAVGIHGGNFNNSGPAPAHTAIFDYFFDTTRPIVPEDTPAP